MTDWETETNGSDRKTGENCIDLKNEEDSTRLWPLVFHMMPQSPTNFIILDFVCSGPRDLNWLKAARPSLIILYILLTLWVFVDHAPWYSTQKQGSGTSASSPPWANIMPLILINVFIIAFLSPVFFFSLSIVDLQCCLSFWHTAKWFSYMYTYSFSYSFPFWFLTGYWI